MSVLKLVGITIVCFVGKHFIIKYILMSAHQLRKVSKHKLYYFYLDTNETLCCDNPAWKCNQYLLIICCYMSTRHCMVDICSTMRLCDIMSTILNNVRRNIFLINIHKMSLKWKFITFWSVLFPPSIVKCWPICRESYCEVWVSAVYVTWGAFKKKLSNLRALKISTLCKNYIFQRMGKIFCVEFQRYPLKFHTKYLNPYIERCVFNSDMKI